MATNEEGKNFWECWVCQTRGTTIRSLLFQLKTPTDQASEVMKYLPKGSSYNYTPTESVQLPKEFQLLYEATTTSITANKIRKYNSFSKIDTKVFLEVRGKKYPAIISNLPFYKKSYVKGASK
jgi:hypothetical protein